MIELQSMTIRSPSGVGWQWSMLLIGVFTMKCIVLIFIISEENVVTKHIALFVSVARKFSRK